MVYKLEHSALMPWQGKPTGLWRMTFLVSDLTSMKTCSHANWGKHWGLPCIKNLIINSRSIVHRHACMHTHTQITMYTIIHSLWYTVVTSNNRNTMGEQPYPHLKQEVHLTVQIHDHISTYSRPHLGHVKVSWLGRWPHFRGEFTLGSILWDILKWPQYRGGLISGVQIRGSSLYN